MQTRRQRCQIRLLDPVVEVGVEDDPLREGARGSLTHRGGARQHVAQPLRARGQQPRERGYCTAGREDLELPQEGPQQCLAEPDRAAVVADHAQSQRQFAQGATAQQQLDRARDRDRREDREHDDSGAGQQRPLEADPTEEPGRRSEHGDVDDRVHDRVDRGGEGARGEMRRLHAQGDGLTGHKHTHVPHRRTDARSLRADG
jgi:hypothetical protein